MNAQLARAMIQRQRKGVTPPRTITAPIADTLDRDHTTEADRLAQFDLSARFVGGRHPDPFNPLPDVSPRPAPAPAGSLKPAPFPTRSQK